MKNALFIVVVELFWGLSVWTPGMGAGVTEQDFKLFLEDYESKVIPLSSESELAYFEALVSGDDADYEKSSQVSIALEKVFSDTMAFAKVKAFKEGGQITDPRLKRQLDIIYLYYLGNQIDLKALEEIVRRQMDIEQKFNTFRAIVGEQILNDNQIDSILRYSTNSTELEETWKASKRIGREVAGEIIELVKLRNRAAQELGFANFYEMQLTLSEQNPSEIAALFDQLDSLTRDAFTVLKGQIDSALAVRYMVSQNRLQPWHYQNRFFQDAPAIYEVNLDAFYRDKDLVAISRDYFAGIGLPVDSILDRSDLYERPGKYQHAQCSDINRAGDVRIICSVRPDYYWMGTMLHELGHGVHALYNSRQEPWLLRTSVHAFTDEAVAEFFGRLAGNPNWLVQAAGVPKEEVDNVTDECMQMLRLQQMVFCRWVQVMVRFERALYENPNQNLNQLWWDLVEKYQSLTRPERRDEPDWASKIHIATSPVYYHNYMMGELLASQFAYAIGNKVLNSTNPFNADFSGNPNIGIFFMEKVFYPGKRYPWNEMIERATGEKLTSAYFVRQFVETQ